MPEGFKPTSSVTSAAVGEAEGGEQKGTLGFLCSAWAICWKMQQVAQGCTREQQNLDSVTAVRVLPGGGLGSGGCLLVMIIRGEHFHTILCVSREDHHLTNFSRRELGPGELGDLEWVVTAVVVPV